MEGTQLADLLALKSQSLDALRAKYAEVFDGQPAPSNNKVALWRKIAYRLQELATEGLSTETHGKIEQLIQQYDPVNNQALRPEQRPKQGSLSRDRRLPIPGTVITKTYKGTALEVKILKIGFEYHNKVYRSLSAIAKDVTGAHWNGFLFFKL